MQGAAYTRRDLTVCYFLEGPLFQQSRVYSETVTVLLRC